MIKTVAKIIFILLISYSPLGFSLTDKNDNWDTSAELQNVFRIDHKVDEVTIIVQRKFASLPIIVIQPDGKKWYSDRFPDGVRWTTGSTADIIYIPKPMPGPWQLVGKIVPGSKIKKISKLNIEVDPLPQPLFQGEVFKSTARLVTKKEKLRLPGLDYVVKWTGKFISDHNSKEDNFLSGTILVGNHKDNGQNYDKAPDDGDFTLELNLDYPAGHYTYKVEAENKVFSRSVQKSFLLSPYPLKFEIIKPDNPITDTWHLQVDIDNIAIQLSDTVLQMDLVNSNSVHIPIDVDSKLSAHMLIPLPTMPKYGNYQIVGNFFATTADKRQIVIRLPELSLNYEAPTKQELTPAEDTLIQAKEKAETNESSMKKVLILVISTNIIIFILAIAGFFVWRRFNPKSQGKEDRIATKTEIKNKKPKLKTKTKTKDPFADKIDLTATEEELP